MRRMISTLALVLAAALVGVTITDPDRPKAAAALPDRGIAATPDDFLLLHEGDSVRVLFRDDAGPGSVRYVSLSENSRLDIIHHGAGGEQYVFSKENGWQTYPREVGGQFVTIVLRERGENSLDGELPRCSDVVVRIENAAILSPHHTDVGGPGVRCEVCNAVLDW